MIEKILERLEEEKQRLRKMRNNCIALSDKEVCDIEDKAYNFCKEIVQEVAKEYGNGWIPCSERLPEQRDWYLAVFEEVDTGFRGLPFIADYLMGVHTKYTTEDGWIIANCTDIEDERAEYYKKLRCVAWQPLPAPYQKGEQKKAFNEEKCKDRRSFASCADAYCSDDCDMECLYQKGE